MSIKLLTSADLHLGKASSSADGIGEKNASKFTWFQMVDMAIDHGYDAIILAGDIVEQENRYFEAVSALEKGLDKLQEYDISVIMTAGNHDYDVLPRIIDSKEYEHVHFLGRGGKWETKILRFKDTRVQILGWSFPSRHHEKNPLESLDPSVVESGIITIGVVHGEFDISESKYAPLTLAGLTDAEADVWVIGHIHKPEVFQASSPLIYYTGSPHAFSSKEPGVHGPVVLTVTDKGVEEHEWLDCSPVRYEQLVIDITELNNPDELPGELVEAQENLIRNKLELSDTLELLVLDVVFSGYVQDIHQIDEFISHREYEDLNRELEGVKTSIRTVSNRCEVKVSDLENLSKENSPAGLIAKALLDISNQNNSEFLETVREALQDSVQSLNTHRTYIPLRNSEIADQISVNKEDLDTLLSQELNRFLSELLKTKEEVRT